MQTLPTLLSAALLCTGLARAGTVEVQFEQPDRYTDAGSQRDTMAVQSTLRDILQTPGTERLPASHTLALTITDGERVPAEGSEVISDMAYLSRITRHAGRSSLPYEQRMLSDWCDSRFGGTAR